MTGALPFYFIYGVAPREIDARFVHVERVSARGHLHRGDVRPHRHAELHQVSFWISGGGRYFIEAEEQAFRAPALNFIPAGVAHGFKVGPDADAIVVSATPDFLREVLGEGELSRAEGLNSPSMTRLDEAEAEAYGFDRIFPAIEREYRWSAPGRADAIGAYLKLALVGVARLKALRPETPSRRSDLAARFRDLLEARYAEWSVQDYVSALAATDYLLNTAVRQTFGHGVLAAIHARRMLEAKRLLLYTDQPVAETAYALGFSDPAYFSRFFARRAGEPPGQWRERRRRGGGALPSDEEAG